MDFCLKQLLIREQYLRKSILAVSMSTTVKGSVMQANNQVYVVDLSASICECGQF